MYTTAQASYFGCDLRLEAKPVRSEGDVTKEAGAEHLEAGLHIGQIDIR